MKIGIVIATYFKKDHTTKNKLVRALESIKNQIYQDYKVFLIGDKYEDEKEFLEIATSIIPHQKMYYENLKYAKERDKYYGTNHSALWNSGGCNARNHGNDIAKTEVDFVCQLDHDDYYLETHLDSIVNAINKHSDAAFIYTLANHMNCPSFPAWAKADGSIIEALPQPCNLTHSSACINNKKIPLKYRDVLEEDGNIYPSDADMWRRISDFCTKNGLKSYLVCRVSCVHENEGSLF